MIALSSSKKEICEGTIKEDGEWKTPDKSSDVQGRALQKRMLGRADVVNRHETLQEGVGPIQNCTGELGPSSGSEI